MPDVLKSMVSPRAFVKADSSSGLITVTDALTNVEKVQGYINSLNAQLLRQVVLELEVIQVTLSDQYSNGIDWRAVAGTIGSGNSFALVGPAGPGALSGNAAGSATFVLGENSKRSASQLMIQALQEYGKVATAYSSVVTTTNRMPVPIGSNSTQAYLRQTSSPYLATGSGLASGGGLSPGEISTGFTMMLTPVILDSNRVLLQSVVQISALKDIQTFTSGEGIYKQSVQLPTVNRFTTLQRTSVQAGQTLVLAGYESEQTQVDDADIVRGFLPMARRGGRSKSGTVILILSLIHI